MSGGGKGGSQTTQVTIPEWVREPAQRNLARAEEISRIGYVPYYGPDVAAFQPAQTAAFQNTANAAGAFGMQGGMPNMPEPTTFAPGVQGYSSAPILEAAMNELQVTRPGQFQAIADQFIDPYAVQQPSGGKGGAGSGATYSPPPTDGNGPVREQQLADWYASQRVPNTSPFGGGGIGGAFGNIFGDGGFFDDTFLDFGLIDGQGRFGFAAPVTSAILGGGNGNIQKDDAMNVGNNVLSK
jgi:hypothetical protein